MTFLKIQTKKDFLFKLHQNFQYHTEGYLILNIISSMFFHTILFKCQFNSVKFIRLLLEETFQIHKNWILLLAYIRVGWNVHKLTKILIKCNQMRFFFFFNIGPFEVHILLVAVLGFHSLKSQQWIWHHHINFLAHTGNYLQI